MSLSGYEDIGLDLLSLPPLLKDHVQGRLDVIILRPVTILALPHSQCLEFQFCWWGRSYIHHLRLNPNSDEVKLVFNIRCDFNGLQRYFYDADELKVDISLAHIQCKEEPCYASASLDADSNLQYSKHKSNKNKKWRCGDHVGRFVLKNLKLNTRGEYVSECNIFDNSGSCCGSVVVFMLYTNEDSRGRLMMSGDMSTKHTQLRKGADTLNLHVDNKENTCERKCKSQNIFASPKAKVESTRVLRDNLSPRFVPLEKEKISPSKTQGNRPINRGKNIKSKQSPQKKIANKNLKLTTIIPKPQIIDTLRNSPFEVTLDAQAEQNFILSKLFSFVDSGAIQPSDLPTLIQIYQGRSPSIDLCSTGDSTFPSNDPEKEIFSLDKNNSPNQETEVKSSYSMVSKDKKTVTFSGISYHSDTSQPVDQSNVTRVFDDDFMKNYLPTQKIIESTSNEPEMDILPETNSLDKISSAQSDHASNYSMSRNENEESISMTESETSLLILRFNCIQFYSGKSDMKPNKILKQIRSKVRQRSRLCYFVEVLLEFEGMEDRSQTALYVSRQVDENQDVIFNASQIFRLLKPNESQNFQGFLKFRVSRRFLGKRQRELVGVAVISLRELQKDEEREMMLNLPLWVPSNTSEKSSIRDGSCLELPIGSLNFSVAFAIANIPNDLMSEKSCELLSCEYDNENYVPCSSKEECIATLDSVIEKVNDSPETISRNVHEILNETFTTETRTDSVVENETNESSLLMENGAAISLISSGDKTSNSEILQQQVHLELIEANGLPSLRTKRTGETFPPNCYIQTDVSSDTYRTQVIRCSSSPKWNYATDLQLRLEDMQNKNFHLILKAFHSFDGSSQCPDDVLLGFATIETQFLWKSFASFCGWVPLLNVKGDITGEIKVSLTPRRAKSFHQCLPREITIQNSLQISPEKTRSTSVLPTESHLRKDHDYSPLNPSPIFKNCGKMLHDSLTKDSEILGPNIDTCKDTEKAVEANPHSSTKPSVYHNSHEPVDSTDTREVSYLNYCNYIFNKEGRNKPHLDDRRSEQLSPSTQAIRDHNKPNLHRTDFSVTSSQLPSLEAQSKPKEVTNYVFEGLQWMNHFSSFDTPSASYIDLSEGNQNINDVQSVKKNSEHTKRKLSKKSRIAANLYLLNYE